ncbi:hypothetical protein [Rhodopirellula sp. P2]|uniref:hypothetical protein n=1 Tax=Rhodopirellula sp. P2 TaxID=2127060 RepID=UPI0023675C95|nr:hypothetical protein [Rhodopirellula sp. P2]WDQ19020.1 hypothetical protein PSR62_10895 [Rhodopirellula sp. P2]
MADSNAKTNSTERSFEADLLTFFNDRTQDGDARHLVYRHLIDRDPERLETLLEQAVDDPFIPLRYLAIQ